MNACVIIGMLAAGIGYAVGRLVERHKPRVTNITVNAMDAPTMLKMLSEHKEEHSVNPGFLCQFYAARITRDIANVEPQIEGYDYKLSFRRGDLFVIDTHRREFRHKGCSFPLSLLPPDAYEIEGSPELKHELRNAKERILHIA